jgi:hypothetical protein
MASPTVRLRRCAGATAAFIALASTLVACSGGSHTATKPVATTRPLVVTSRPIAATRAPTSSSSTITSATSSSAPALSAPTTTSAMRSSTSSTITTAPSPATSIGLVLNSQPAPSLSAPPTMAASLRTAGPGAVAVAMIKALWTVNAVKDKTPYAAELRATAYMTASYAAEIKGTPPQAAPGAQWQSWFDHHVVTTVRAVREYDSGAPVSTPSTAYLQYGVTVVPHGAHGWKGADNTYTQFVELARASSRASWLVAAVEISE